MIRFILFGALAAVAITIIVVAVIPRSEGTSISLPQVETTGLPEHRLMLIGPNDPTFYKLMAEKTSGAGIRAAKPFSVFVVNNAARSVAACMVKWDVLQSDGRIITHSRANSGTLQIVPDGRSAHFSDDIVPNSNRLFSLIDSVEDSERQFRMGGGSPDLVRQLSESVKVTVSIDGVLFTDGLFVGPDTKNYFARLSAEIEANRDLNAEIAQLADTSVKPEAITNHLETLANGQLNVAQQSSGENLGYSIMKKRYATRLLTMRKAKGDRAVLEFIRAEMSKPTVILRKL